MRSSKLTTELLRALPARSLLNFSIVLRFGRNACFNCSWMLNKRFYSHAPKTITINGKTYETDEWTNVPSSITKKVSRNLHLENSHPLATTRATIESSFPPHEFPRFNDLDPVVSVYQNFDSLGFPADHPGRSRADTYYVNKSTVLRTHTSAHQAETFKSAEEGADGYLISADVYRRDAIDRSHYPVFHQMEGARSWSRKKHGHHKDALARAVEEDLARIPQHQMKVIDLNPPFHRERNPVQKESGHTEEEVVAVGNHLKRTLEIVVANIFGKAREAQHLAGIHKKHTKHQPNEDDELKVRWVEAYFPFTSPSWELEVWWQGDWLELLGCGVVKQDLFNNAGVPHRMGWAFGLGLERIAMLLFGIPDIRLFWSLDTRFLKQFREDTITHYVPFSKYPPCYKDVSFWLPGSVSAAGGGGAGPETFQENDLMELIREIAGNDVEDVKLLDEFSHPQTHRRSMCYRINYRSLERTLTNEEVNNMQSRVIEGLKEKFRVELR